MKEEKKLSKEKINLKYVYPNSLNLTKLEFIHFQLKWVCLNLKYSDKELLLASYVYVYGKEAVTKAYNDKLHKSKQSVSNMLTKIRNKGLVTDNILNPDIPKLFTESYIFELKIVLNEKENN